MRRLRSLINVSAVVTLITIGIGDAAAQQPPKSRNELLSAARRIMEAARFATFVTVDESGQPQSRLVDPFAPDSAMVVWIGTNPRTRKVAQLQKNARVALTYFDRQAMAYVTILGRAQLVNDAKEKQSRFKPEWSAFYPERDRDYTLIKVVPERLELISERDGVGFTDAASWRPPVVDFRP
ncbi:MAG TPA: pyridoxamine 5'-phosphate oxidase family protein [Longimicrobiales bacterium]